MLTVRLPEKIECELEILSEQQKVTKTEIIRQALFEYLKANRKTPYETGMDLFGCDETRISNGSVAYKQNVGRHIHEKHSH